MFIYLYVEMYIKNTYTMSLFFLYINDLLFKYLFSKFESAVHICLFFVLTFIVDPFI